jgi:hypothetical protein
MTLKIWGSKQEKRHTYDRHLPPCTLHAGLDEECACGEPSEAAGYQPEGYEGTRPEATQDDCQSSSSELGDITLDRKQ